MFYAIGWLVVLCLLGLWSLAAWAFHGVAAWAVSNAGVLAGGAVTTQTARLPDWLLAWVPPELAGSLNDALASAVAVFLPALESMLAWAPALAGGLTVAVWVVWAIGSALLVVLGLVISGAIALLRRKSAGKPSPAIGRGTAVSTH